VLATLLAFVGGAAIVFPALMLLLLPRCAPGAVCDGPGMMALALCVFTGPVVGMAAGHVAWTRLLPVLPDGQEAGGMATVRVLAAIPVLLGAGALGWLARAFHG
jgi:hypothetical protein